jgi:serine/threonine protein kinase
MADSTDAKHRVDEWLKPGDKLGNYTILGELSRGPWGVVLLAEQELVGRKVVIKAIAPDARKDEWFENLCKHFRLCARLQGRLNHPNINALYDAGEYEGLPYWFSIASKEKHYRTSLKPRNKCLYTSPLGSWRVWPAPWRMLT